MKCKYCGSEYSGNPKYCPNCGAETEAVIQEAAPEAVSSPVFPAVSAEIQAPENIVMGTVGAVAAAIVGAALIALFAKMGYVTSLGGLLLSFLTVFLYKKMSGGKIGTVGIVICVLLCAAMPYLGYRAGFAWDIAAAEDPMLTLGLNAMGFEHSFSSIFAGFHKLLEMTDSTGDVAKDLFMLYLFTLLGASGSIASIFQKRKKTQRRRSQTILFNTAKRSGKIPTPFYYLVNQASTTSASAAFF